jgi:hypothetical protein
MKKAHIKSMSAKMVNLYQMAPFRSMYHPEMLKMAADLEKVPNRRKSLHRRKVPYTRKVPHPIKILHQKNVPVQFKKYTLQANHATLVSMFPESIHRMM